MVQAEQQRIADSIAKVQEEKRKMDSIALMILLKTPYQA